MALSEAPGFFKVILSSTLNEGKLKIPKKFVKEQGDELSETVKLTIPTGRGWSVRIKRDAEDTIWFQDGLDKFMEDNSIRNHYILVFKYDQNSTFGVQIFDLTAAEIQYTCIDDSRNRHGLDKVEETQTKDGQNDSDSVVECLGSSPPHHPLPGTPASHSGTNQIRRCYFTRRRKQAMEAQRSMFEMREANSVDEDNVKTNHSGNDSSSIFFKVTLTPANVVKRILYVPSDFARLHMAQSTRLIKLVDAENNVWEVRHIHQGRHHNVLSSGWGRFVKDNKLMVGDVCTFEVVPGDDEVKLRVTISRSGKH